MQIHGCTLTLLPLALYGRLYILVECFDTEVLVWKYEHDNSRTLDEHLPIFYIVE